jgi:hypothetical protein
MLNVAIVKIVQYTNFFIYSYLSLRADVNVIKLFFFVTGGGESKSVFVPGTFLQVIYYIWLRSKPYPQILDQPDETCKEYTPI